MAHELGRKTLAGVVLGCPLSFAVCGLYGYLGPGSRLDNYFVVLFLLLPVWVGVMSAAFACRTGWRAWAWLALGNAVGFGLLALVRHWSH
ncbi:hypothetical protein [Herbaspirillum chlorophenolicum]|jgi:hypothetical protein|uniref:hypothetical protein n=1 Tax=Herbaspirillum chlorophenolicum TaxID=211589 RepID=UPI00067B6634|nr:hypothetical protein [Herbaspirillum chlorophenolicum]